MSVVALMHEHTWPVVRRGGERYLHDLAWYLHEHTALEPRVVTAAGRPRRDRIDDVPVDRTWHLALSPLGRLATRFPAASATVSATTGRRALVPTAPSVVHAFSPSAALAGHRAGVPTVFTTVGTPDRQLARSAPARWATVASAAEQAHVVTAVGQEAAREFEDALGRPVLALPPGIQMHRFPARLDARTGPPRIVFASTVTPLYKGFRAVLEAFPAILAVHPDARLVVLGPGNVDAMVDRATPAVGRARSRIERWLPGPQEMPRHYADGTVTVLASRGEAFGLVLAESLACGTPIVASDHGGPAEILAGAEGTVGFSARPHDPDSIAEAVLEAIELAARRDTPTRCRAHARQWSWTDHVGPRHERMYDAVATRTPRPDPWDPVSSD